MPEAIVTIKLKLGMIMFALVQLICKFTSSYKINNEYFLLATKNSQQKLSGELIVFLSLSLLQIIQAIYQCSISVSRYFMARRFFFFCCCCCCCCFCFFFFVLFCFLFLFSFCSVFV